MAKYIPVIGLEVHIQLNTKTKMFCACGADIWPPFAKASGGVPATPNTHVCPTCLGLPGALPVPNKEAIEKVIKIGLSLGSKISKMSYFDRKNYFYPDLPKGYQISQFYFPFCKGGNFTLEGGKNIRIREIHLEEDTGKSFHDGGTTLLDFNKSGIPLAELVTEPDFRSAEEAVSFCKKIQQLVREIGVSEADMEKGNMRLEANISLKEVEDGRTEAGLLKWEVGSKDLPDYKVEVKNINSFRFLGKVIEYELKRQQELLEAGEKVIQETRGYNEETGETFSQRVKETAKDYRYFPEPDIPPIEISDSWLAEIKASIPELPWEKKDNFIKEYPTVATSSAEIIVEDVTLLNLFEQAVKLSGKDNAKKVADTLVNKKETRVMTPAEIVEIVKAQASRPSMSEAELKEICKKVISENGKAVEDYKKGKEASLKFLVGQVMRLSAGKANPQEADRVLREMVGFVGIVKEKKID